MRTEVFRKECHTNHVYAESKDLRDNHIDMPAVNVIDQQDTRIHHEGTDHVVISNATIISSLRMSAVKEMATMFKNSFSNKTRDMIMIAAPAEGERSICYMMYNKLLPW